MRATMREALLNKTSAFTADPHFRHIIGQTASTFSIPMRWIGTLGNRQSRKRSSRRTRPQPRSLIFTVLKNALSLETRSLYTVYCDEIQNLSRMEVAIETVLSEARKFGVAVVSANQFLDQYPAEMRAAILAMGTHAFFQLRPGCCSRRTWHLTVGILSGATQNLPQRHCVVKSGSDRWIEVQVPLVRTAPGRYTVFLIAPL